MHDAHDFFEKYRTRELRGIDVKDHVSANKWLAEQMGKKYDWTALVSWVVRRDWQMPDRWFCSELTETFRTLFDRQVFREQLSRITPRHQDMIV